MDRNGSGSVHAGAGSAGEVAADSARQRRRRWTQREPQTGLVPVDAMSQISQSLN